jgi:hypothetical protein
MNKAIAIDRIASEHYRFDEKRHIHAVEQRVFCFAELIGVVDGVGTPRVQDDQVGVAVLDLRPAEDAVVHPLGEQAQARAIPEDQLDPVRTARFIVHPFVRVRAVV